MQRIENPYPQFHDGRGNLLDGGRIYIGEANADPETHPLDVFVGNDVQIPQPLRVLGGYIVSGSNLVLPYVSENDYSIRARDADGSLVFYLESAVLADAPYQPLSATLTAIAALTTTSYGRSLLTLSNQAALQAAVGAVASLPLTGGTVTGNILRQGAGAHLYHADAAMTGGRVFVTAADAPDPTSQAGDIWLKLA